MNDVNEDVIKKFRIENLILVFNNNVLEKEKYIWILSLNLNIVFYILGVSY